MYEGQKFDVGKLNVPSSWDLKLKEAFLDSPELQKEFLKLKKKKQK
ncbi:hypothetical protein [Heyndrickxia ginsengihumi]